MLIKIRELTGFNIYVDSDDILRIFENYEKENNLKLNDKDKIDILKKIGFDDDEVAIILQYV